MHTIGGGVAKNVYEHLLSLIPVHDDTQTHVSKLAVKTANVFMNQWRKPCEFCRDARDFANRHLWKMREASEALLYSGPALMNNAVIRDLLEPDKDNKQYKAEEFMKLIIGLRLIAGTTHDSPSEADRNLARELLKGYFEHSKTVYTEASITYKLHCLLHLSNECAHFKAHLGSFDAYPFENFLGWLRNNLIFTGKSVLQQFINSLRRIRKHKISGSILGTDFTSESGKQDLLQCTRMMKDVQLELVKKCGTLDIPSHTVLSCDEKTGILRCSGFTITNRYPNNIVLMRWPQTSTDYIGNREVDIVVVAKIIRSEDNRIALKGRKFCPWRPAHSKWNNTYGLPGGKDLRDLGMYEADINDLSAADDIWDVQNLLIGKCFPYHMVSEPNAQAQSPLSTECKEGQWWTLIREMHTGPTSIF